jgi:hypothetical protein
MTTDFALSLRRFLTDHLAGLRGCSTNTIVSYRDAFKLLIWPLDAEYFGSSEPSFNLVQPIDRP